MTVRCRRPWLPLLSLLLDASIPEDDGCFDELRGPCQLESGSSHSRLRPVLLRLWKISETFSSNPQLVGVLSTFQTPDYQVLTRLSLPAPSVADYRWRVPCLGTLLTGRRLWWTVKYCSGCSPTVLVEVFSLLIHTVFYIIFSNYHSTARMQLFLKVGVSCWPISMMAVGGEHREHYWFVVISSLIAQIIWRWWAGHDENPSISLFH